MSLSDFFHPIGFNDIFFVICFVFFADLLGSGILRFFSPPAFIRIFHWVLGLAVFSTLWLSLKSFIGFSPVAIIFLFLSVSLISGFNVFKRPFFLDFKSIFNNSWLLFLALIPLMPFLWTKLSLPPLPGDEIGYHYYAPYQVIAPLKMQQARDDFYSYIPQNLNNIYRVQFAITKSYASARVTHLMVIVCGLTVVAGWLKLNFGKGAWALWSLFSPYIVNNFVFASTSGMVDMATSSVVLVFICLLMSFIKSVKLNLLQIAIVFSAVAIGIKYTSLIPSLSYFSFTLLYRPKPFIKIFAPNKQNFLVALLILLCGGYWMVLNLYRWGSPIPSTDSGGNIFAGWTTPISLNSTPEIFDQILFGDVRLKKVFLFNSPLLLLSLFLSPSVLLLFVGYFIEVIQAKFISGFFLRYYTHWTYLFLLFLIIPIFVVIPKKLKLVQAGLVILMSLVLLQHAKFVISQNIRNRSPIEIAFAKEKISIHSWFQIVYPKTSNIIEFCGKPLDQFKKLIVADPDLMYYAAFGQPLENLVNCVPIKLNLTKNTSNVISELKKKPNEASLVVSMHECMQESKVNSLLHTIQDGFGDEEVNYPNSFNQRLFNNEIICNSTPLEKNFFNINNKNLISIYKKYAHR